MENIFLLFKRIFFMKIQHIELQAQKKVTKGNGVLGIKQCSQTKAFETANI